MPEKDKYECAKIVNGILAREYEHNGDIKTSIYHRFVDLDENEDQRELLKSEIHSLIGLFEDALKELGDDGSHYISKDKVKSKIEEIEKEIEMSREIAKNPPDRISGRLLTDHIVELEKTKKVLQSLLEGE